MPRKASYLFVWAVIALSTLGSARFSAAQPADPLDGLGEFILGSMEDWGLPGVAVGVVQDGEILFARGFGLRQLGRDAPVSERTRFQIGSVTKGFAAASVAVLVDDGRVAWDDPVVKHLPWFEMRDPEISRQVTIRDLLAHRSGMAAHAFPALAIVSGREVADRLPLLTNEGAFRTEFRYSNQAYGIIGLLVEAVTGESWGAWLERRILGPLGMEASGASPYEIWDPQFVAPTFLGSAPAGRVGIDDAPGIDVAMPHGVGRNGERRVLPWQSYDNLQPAGSVYSTALDMTSWLRMQLAAGELSGRRVLSPESLSEMHSPQIETQSYAIFADGGTTHAGLGWVRETMGGRTYLSHGGGIFGFPAYVALMPEIDAGVVVLANGSLWTPYYPHQEIVAWVFTRLADLESRDLHAESMAKTEEILGRVEQAVSAQTALRNPAAAPSLDLQAYTGPYEHAADGAFDVTLAGGRLRLDFPGAGAFGGELEHWHDDVFLLHFDGGDGQAYRNALVSFTVDEAGVTGVTVGAFGSFEKVD